MARPSPLPLSLAFHRSHLADMASLVEPETLSWDRAPDFRPDWKSSQTEEAEQSRTHRHRSPEPYLSIRTEIDRINGVPEENRLFTQECIDPHGFTWCADIELCNIEEEKRSAAFARLQEILQQGLDGIGKTKARAEIEIPHPFTPFKLLSAELPAWRNNRYIVTLQTPARLLPPNLHLSGVNSHTALKTHYQAYWSRQHSSITLLNYYARQRLSGTYYHLQRYGPEANYYPEWLTAAGSVFILQIDDDAGRRLLERWNRTGLPAHPNGDGSPADWRSTPYLPEHGYGEIVVNDPWQLERLYQPDEPQTALEENP